MRIIVFGGAGFIGSHFVEQALLADEETSIIVLDKLTYAGSVQNLANVIDNRRVSFREADIRIPETYLETIRPSDVVINFAAESHVDRSLEHPNLFAETNALGPCALAGVCTQKDVKLLVQVSTDEVYGPILHGECDESAPIVPTSPYAASKAAGENLVQAFWRTFQLPVIVTRGCNTYGPRQYPEKLIPMAIRNFVSRKPVSMYGSGSQIREWIHVVDHANAILSLVFEGSPGQVYNIGTGYRVTNFELLQRIAKALDADENLITPVQDRKSHDFRYAVRSQKIRKETSWVPHISMDEALNSCETWLN